MRKDEVVVVDVKVDSNSLTPVSDLPRPSLQFFWVESGREAKQVNKDKWTDGDCYKSKRASREREKEEENTQCDQMLELKVAHFPKFIAQKVAKAVFR